MEGSSSKQTNEIENDKNNQSEKKAPSPLTRWKQKSLLLPLFNSPASQQLEVKDAESIGQLDQKEMAEQKAELNLYITEEIKDLFKHFDIKGDGYLKVADIKLAYKDFEIEVDHNDCQAIVKYFDASGNGHIKFNDFYREMYDIMLNGTLDEHMKMVFDVMDEDADGVIGIEEITKQFQKLGALLHPDEVADVISKIDKDGHGSIDFDHFRSFCLAMDRINILAATPIKGIPQ